VTAHRDAAGNKSLFDSFSSEKEQEYSFSEEKEAKRLLFLVLLQGGSSRSLFGRT
jgi:hypothetical protein